MCKLAKEEACSEGARVVPGFVDANQPTPADTTTSQGTSSHEAAILTPEFPNKLWVRLLAGADASVWTGHAAEAARQTLRPG